MMVELQRRVRFGGFILALVAVLAACAPATPTGANQETSNTAPSASTRSGPKSAVVINSGIAPGLDNRFVITSNNAAGIVLNLYAGKLIQSDNALNRMPRLAEAVPTLDNGLWKVNPDGTMDTRLTLVPNAKWHDGAPFTTKDLLFSDEVYLEKSLPQLTNTARTFVDRLEAVDDRTLIVHWNSAYILADIFSPDMMPAHLLEQGFRQDPQSPANPPRLTTEYVGTGPFKLKELVPGSHFDLTAFDQYPLGRPKIDELRVKYITDGGTLLSNLISGAGDLATGTGPNVSQAQELKSQNWDGTVTTTLGTTYVHMFAQYIDPFDPVLTDKRFHKGLMYSLNRQEFVDTINAGYGSVAEIPWATNDPDYRDYLSKVETYPYDPNRAAQMFQSVGYTKGPDGFLRSTASGQRLSQVEFRTTGEQPFQVRMLAAMSDNFKDAGLDINQVIVPQERTPDRVYRITNPGLEELQYGFGPSFMIGWIHSSKLPTPENRYTIGNYPRYSNPQWDALNDKYAVSIQPAERKQALTDLFVHLQDNLPEMSIIYGVTVQFSSKRLSVPEVNPIWTAEAWDIK